jgi:hypothetical protein
MVSGLVIKREGDAVTLTTLEQVVDRKLVLCVARDVEYTQAPVADLVRRRCVLAHAYARNVPYTRIVLLCHPQGHREQHTHARAHTHTFEHTHLNTYTHLNMHTHTRGSPDRVERRRWRSMTHTHRYPRVSILMVDSTMDVVKQVLDGTKCSAALMPRAVWEEIEGQVKRLSPGACASAASLVQMYAWRSCACKHTRMSVCRTCVALLCT